MKYTDIVTNKRTAVKSALFVFMLCTVIMCAMSVFSGWAPWVIGMLAAHAVVLTLMTFHPKINKLCTFEEMIVTKTYATITSNCGAGTLGVLFIKN